MTPLINNIDTTTDFIYVIAPPQGRVDLLTLLLDKIYNNPSSLPFARNDKIVIAGNIISRKDTSAKGFIAFLKDVLEKGYKNKIGSDQFCVLRGFNEYQLLRNKNRKHSKEIYSKFCNSYRNNYNRTLNSKTLPLKQVLSDIKYIKSITQPFYETNKFFITHSGTNPLFHSLKDQFIPRFSFNTNKSWLKSKKKFEKIVVSTDPTIDKHIIAFNKIIMPSKSDTKGTLSCVVLDDKKGEVIEVITVNEEDYLWENRKEVT